jgi:hypothetical protein
VDLTDFDTVLSREFLGNAFPERKDPGHILILVIRRLGEEPRDFRDGRLSAIGASTSIIA